MKASILEAECSNSLDTTKSMSYSLFKESTNLALQDLD